MKFRPKGLLYGGLFDIADDGPAPDWMAAGSTLWWCFAVAMVGLALLAFVLAIVAHPYALRALALSLSSIFAWGALCLQAGLKARAFNHFYLAAVAMVLVWFVAGA